MRPVDRAEITILSDNYCEQVILGNEMVHRPGGLTVKSGENEVQLLAEHGFAAAIRLYSGSSCHTLLLDTGRSGDVLLNNAACAGIDLPDVEEIILSHGHLDHVGGLTAAARTIRHRVPVFVHPDAFLDRYIKQPDGSTRRFPDFHPDLYKQTNIDFQISREITTIADGIALVTGEIPRLTSYEQGFPPQLAVKDGHIVADTQMWDDQAIVFIVKDRGPVIITGCGHSGIINTIRYGLELSGAKEPLAVIGGFHLCWPSADDIIQQTLADIKSLNPRYIIPCHCTGWEATHLFAQEMKEQFILSTVGCTISL